MLLIFLLLQHNFLQFPVVQSLSSPIGGNSSNVSLAAHLFYTQKYARSGSDVFLACPLVDSLSNGSVLWIGPSLNHSVNSSNPIEFANIKLSLNSLMIFNASLKNQGNYSCFNASDSALHWTVFVLDFPVSPNTIRLIANNESAISLHWQNIVQVPKSTIYEVHILGNSQNKTVNVSALEKKLTFVGLDPYSKYFVSLTPYDQIGPGFDILNQSICTASGVPTATPILTLDSFTNTSATLNFSAGEIFPAPDDPFTCPGTLLPKEYFQGPFKGYRLSLESLIYKRTLNITKSNRTEMFTFNRLLPNSPYRVNVSFSNGRRFGPPASLNFTTLEGVPEPPSLQVEARATDSLRVSFSSSNNRGIVLGYYLRWAECSNSSTVNSTVTQDSYFEIKGLRNATCYRLAAAARTSVGMGNLSPLTEGFTTCSAFSAPILSNITAISDGIKVSWIFSDTPASPDGNHWFRPCMKSSLGICKDVSFNSTSRKAGVFSYIFPFSEVNRLWDHEVILNFTVQTLCLPRECKIDWPCLEVSNVSNVLQLDLSHLVDLLFQPGTLGELSDKAIGSIIGAVFVIFLMICCACIVAFLYCRSSRVYKRRGMGVGGVIGDDFGSGGLDRLDDVLTPLVAPKMRRFEESPHKPIPAEKLAAHVASYHVDDDAGYQAEFEAIEQSVRTSWPTSVARQPDNMAKNRYTNVFAYDHTRVILKNGRKSDYINANYVDGFCRPRAFIAAQGPKDITFDDFWQMVWDENSNIIVMISNFVERGRRKCDQYWPSSGPQTYGSISVQMLSENYLACYVARVFLVKNVKCKKFAKERIVRHYQYTDWRDFDVPLSPLPVLVFVKTTIKEWSPSRGPIIVHCSAGVGRTGTYICIESLIRQLEAEKQVNIRGFLEHIRQQRMKLVQTEQQYAFIHDALREYLLCPEHEISAMVFPKYVQSLRIPDGNGVTGLQKQFDICTDHMPRVYEFTEATKPVNIPKNRLSRRLLPTDLRRVALPFEGGAEGANYINASVVQGYHRLHEFIITQHPIPNSTEADFWRMVWDKNSPLVVVLSSTDSEKSAEFPDFWPTKVNDPLEIGWLRVGFCASEAISEELTRYEFLLSSSREDYALTCQLWRLHNWPSSTMEENVCSDFLKLQSVLVSNNASTANGSTIVVDDYGGNRAGIFVAVNFLINQFNLSGNIDVYYIVKMLHLQRTGIFQSPADLDFIYSIMEQFLMEMQQQDDSSSFLGGCNETSSSPGYANLSLFNGKSLLPPLTTSNSKCSSANGDVLPTKSSTLFPLIASVESDDEKMLEEVEELRSTHAIIPETESALELHSLSSDAPAGDASVNPSLIGVLTPVKRPLNNGFIVKETILPHPLPPPPNQSPPAWPVDDLDESDDPTPTTSLVIETGDGGLHLNGTLDEMTV